MLRRTPAALVALTLGVVTAGFVPAGSAQAADPADPARPATAPRTDDKAHPLGDQQRALTRTATEKLVSGEAKVSKNRRGKNVVRLGRGKYVNYDVERQERIFTVLAEFGAQAKGPHGTPGPKHNLIPKPDRVMDGGATDDNSTLWRPNFNRAHYLDLMFGPGARPQRRENTYHRRSG